MVHYLYCNILWVFDKCIILYIHHNNIIQNDFTTLKNFLYYLFNPIPSPRSLATIDMFMTSRVFPYPVCHIIRILYKWAHFV